MKKDFLTLLDRTTDELKHLIDEAIRLKKERGAGILRNTPLAGKSVALIFEKSSTRTRVSFDVGVSELGGRPIYLSVSDIQLGRGESVSDTARVLSRYVHIIMIRTFAHSRLEEFAGYASAPVINGLTDEYHPCQIMADVMTFYERFGIYRGIKVAYIGDGNNIAHSWLNGAARFGFDLAIASPGGCEPDKNITALAINEAKKTGANIIITADPAEAVNGADVVTTDVWASMGQEKDAARKSEMLKSYQVNAALMKAAGKDAVFLHCLPAHKGEEVTEEVFESSFSLVFDEAENRLHVQKAIMLDII
ncbi:MAG: ornithine carbamoyltransferase [Deferribacteraceae bacterium]|jgi:ornithine carbamoyltransferase|nr:ornithine carbamoyltransferase [Deferribacteraceae bacterium]